MSKKEWRRESEKDDRHIEKEATDSVGLVSYHSGPQLPDLIYPRV